MSTKKVFDSDSLPRRAIIIASTAAVDSSSMDAFAVFMPVKSVIMVWKLISASRRP